MLLYCWFPQAYHHQETSVLDGPKKHASTFIISNDTDLAVVHPAQKTKSCCAHG
jgi:hypothetical protein